MYGLYRFLLILPLMLFGYHTDPAKVRRAKEALSGFDLVVEKALLDFQVPGVAIGIVVDGQVVMAKGFGHRDLENRLPVNEETLFPVGSCTKAFTTFLAGNLVDEGLISWDQPVVDILPQFRLWNQYATMNVTMRDLFTHRTGMPRHELVWYNSRMSKEELLKRIRYLEPSHEIRERYQYIQLMYFVAGLAMEQVTKKTWEQMTKEKILDPLGMVHTNFSIVDTIQGENFAFPYIEKNDQLKKMKFRDISLIGPAGSLNSNVLDLTRWVEMQLAGGVYKNQALISPATLQELHAPQVIVPGTPECQDALLYAYGMGWGIFSYKGHYFLSHDGISDGFTSMVGLLPNDGVGIIVLTNRNMTPLSRYLSVEIVDRILDLPRQDWLQEGVESVRKKKEMQATEQKKESELRKKGTCPCHTLDEYAGIYEHPGYGKLSIELVDGQLRAIYNDLTFFLEHWHYDVFSVRKELEDMIISFEGTKFAFSNGSDGEISTVSVPFEPTADDIVFTRRPEERHATMSYLKQFTGAYTFYGYVIEIVIRDHALMAIIPGQPNYALVPITDNEFQVKGMLGSTVRFVMDPTNKVSEVLLVHPYGTFSATPRKVSH